MKEAVQRWGKRSLWVLTVVLALYVIVMGVDFIWYRSHVPVRFQSANWEGCWETRRFWGLSGRLLGACLTLSRRVSISERMRSSIIRCTVFGALGSS